MVDLNLNIQPYKNRQIDFGKSVDVYRNINKSGYVYSVRQNGLVVGHSRQLTLKNVQFITRIDTIKKIRRTSKKEICAYIRGNIGLMSGMPFYSSVKFNPKDNDTFIGVGPNMFQQPVYFAEEVIISDSVILARGINYGTMCNS